MTKIRPKAEVECNYGTDGRDEYNEIYFYCPNCDKSIKKNDIACTECGTFFDWSKKARIEVITTVVWE